MADDGAKSAQFEHTILITEGKPDLLTVKSQ
jgi:methionine aminopeptidase